MDYTKKQTFLKMLHEPDLAYSGLIGATETDPQDDNCHHELHEFDGLFWYVALNGWGLPIEWSIECYTLKDIVRQPTKWADLIGQNAVDKLRLREYQQAMKRAA